MSTTSVVSRPAARRPARAAAPPARYFPSLDGIRAIAVVAVMLYHFGVPGTAGGFLGVDLFFVLSGYLITGQLITRWVTGPRVTAASFALFWAARARRLLPALAAMLAVTSAAAATVDRAQLSLFRGDLLAAATYSSNWWYVFHHRSYFVAAGRPPLLQHLWSLAVEEQFYLLWPVLVLAVILIVRRRELRGPVLFAVAIGLMLASSAVMGIGSALEQVPQLGDPSRWYFGTDSHSMGLLAGAALAALRGGDGLGSRARPAGPPAPARASLAGFAALAAVVVALSQVGEYSAWLYRAGFLVFSLLAAVLIWVAVQPGPLADLLGRPWLTAIGRRSYTLYLWHWPVAALTRPGVDLHDSATSVFVLRVLLTVGLTEATYRLVEQPVRRLGWSAYWRRMGDWNLGRVPGPAVSVTVVAALAIAVFWPGQATVRHQRAYAVGVTYVHCPADARGTVRLPATAPRGAQCANTPATANASAAASPPAGPGPVDGPVDGPVYGPVYGPVIPRVASAPPSPTASSRPPTTPTTPPATRVRGTATPSPAAPPARPGSLAALAHERLVVYGDSVPLGAISQLSTIFASVTNDAVEGIQAWTLLPRMIRDGQAGRLAGAVVLLHTGDNGLISSAQLRQALQAAAGARLVIVATPHVPREWQAPNVRTVEALVPQFRNTVLLDWNRDMAHGGGWLYSDGVHLTPAGRVAYSRLVAQAALTKVSPR